MFETKLTRFFTPPSKGTGAEWGRERSPDPYGSNPAVGARESALVRGGASWAYRRCGPSRRLVPHARLHITGHGGRKAGARAAAVMPSATLRRTGAARAANQLFGRCTLHVPSERRPRSLPLPRAPTCTYTYTYTPPSPCHRCLLCPPARPPRAVSQLQNNACLC